ncbi:DUF4258 domain-containing protein [Paenibacillus sp. IITD108]|uniref:DUF4258 domain-containing protein n=1 Tax=Paenibacillus sp. IITD108 TaxID=3116649 RepID=UPI002F40A0DB
MHCLQPINCNNRALRHLKKFESLQSEAELLLTDFQEKLQSNSSDVRFRLKLHASQREMFRAFSRKDILEAVTNGWVIEMNERSNNKIIIVMYFIHTGPKSYRPIHLVCVLNSPFDWEVITVYDPRSRSWWWGNNYSERICWCAEQLEEEY